ncbi:hypothetical protein [Amycolatopsis sp. cmx-4-68]|uniref:hypothetical protein n=1 Tax=Amycolatopsis sp. cmx-4-68 TaxID=2790938 RepID=UPI00397D2E72
MIASTRAAPASFATDASPSSQLVAAQATTTTTTAAPTTNHQLIPGFRAPRSILPPTAEAPAPTANRVSDVACGRAHRPSADQSTHPDNTIAPASNATPPNASTPMAGRRPGLISHLVMSGQSPGARSA